MSMKQSHRHSPSNQQQNQQGNAKRLPASSLSAVHALEKRCLTMVALAEKDAARRQLLLNGEIERLKESLRERDQRIEELMGTAVDDDSGTSGGRQPTVYSGLRACEKQLRGFEEQLFSARNAFTVVHSDVTSQLSLLRETRLETEGRLLASVNTAVFVQEHYIRFMRQRRLQHAFVSLLRRIFLKRWELRDRAQDTPELAKLHQRIEAHTLPPLASFSLDKFMKLLASKNKIAMSPLGGYQSQSLEARTPKNRSRRRFRTPVTPVSKLLSSIASPRSPVDYSVLSPLSKSVVQNEEFESHGTEEEVGSSISPLHPTVGLRMTMRGDSQDSSDVDVDDDPVWADSASITEDDALLVLALLEGRRVGSGEQLSLGSWLFRIVQRNGSPLVSDVSIGNALTGNACDVKIEADPWLANFISAAVSGDCPAAQPVLMYLCSSVDLLQRFSHEVQAHLAQCNVELRELQQHRLLAPERQWLEERSRDLCFREVPRLEAHHNAVGNALLKDIQESASDRHGRILTEFESKIKEISADTTEVIRRSSELLSHDTINDMLSDGLYLTPEAYIRRVDTLYTLPARSFWMMSWRAMVTTATLQLMSPSSWRDALATAYVADVGSFQREAAAAAASAKAALVQYEAWLDNGINRMNLVTLTSGPMKGKRVPLSAAIGERLLQDKKRELASSLGEAIKDLWRLTRSSTGDDSTDHLPTMRLQLASSLSDLLRALRLAHSEATTGATDSNNDRSVLDVIHELGGIPEQNDVMFQAPLAALGGDDIGESQVVDVSLVGLMRCIVELFSHPPPTPFVRDAAGSETDARPIALLSLEAARQRWEHLQSVKRQMGQMDSIAVIERAFPFLRAMGLDGGPPPQHGDISQAFPPPMRVLETLGRTLEDSTTTLDAADDKGMNGWEESDMKISSGALTARALALSPSRRAQQAPSETIAARDARRAMQINATVCKRIPLQWFNVLELGTVTTVHVSSSSGSSTDSSSRPMWRSILTASDASVVENIRRRIGGGAVADQGGTGAIRILPPSADFEDGLKPFSTIGAHEVEFVAMPPGVGARRAARDDPKTTEYSNVVPIVRTPITPAVSSWKDTSPSTSNGPRHGLGSSDVIYVNTILAPPPSHFSLSTLINRADEAPERVLAGVVMNAAADYDTLRMEYSNLLGALEVKIRQKYAFQFNIDDLYSEGDVSPDTSPLKSPSSSKRFSLEEATNLSQHSQGTSGRRSHRRVRNGVVPVNITVFSLTQLSAEITRQSSQRTHLQQQVAALTNEVAQLKASLVHAEAEHRAEKQALGDKLQEAAQQNAHLKQELEEYISHQRKREAAQTVIDRLPETVKELRYTVGEDTFGPCWQESILRIREVVQQDLLIEAYQLKQRISHMLVHEIESSQVIERRFEDRMESVMEEIDKDKRREAELVKMRIDAEKQAYYDMCQVELQQAKEAAEQDKLESIERHREAYDRRIREMEELFSRKSRQLQARQEEKERLLDSKLLSIRRLAREKEMQLTDHFEARHALLTEELEAEVRASKDAADRIRNDMEAEVLKIRANNERAAHETYLTVKGEFDRITAGIYDLVLEDRCVSQELFFESRWETLKELFKLSFGAQVQRVEEREEDFRRNTARRLQAALEAQSMQSAQSLDEMEMAHSRALKEAEQSHTYRVEHYKNTHDTIVNDLREKRISSEQVFWSQCQNAVLEAERFVHSYKKELEVAHTKGYEELIQACDQYLEHDVTLSKEAFESELRLRRQHLLDYCSYYHKIELRVQQLMWQELGARSYVERLADTELESLALAKALDFETVKLMALNIANAATLDACQWGCIEEEENMLFDDSISSEEDEHDNREVGEDGVGHSSESAPQRKGKKDKKKKKAPLRGHSSRIVFGRIRGTEGAETQLFVPRVDLIRTRERYERKLLEVLRVNEQIQRDYLSALDSEISTTRSEGSRISHHHSNRVDIIAQHLSNAFAEYQNSRSFIVENKLDNIVALTTKKLTSLTASNDSSRLPFFDHLSQVHKRLELTEQPNKSGVLSPTSPNRRRAKTPGPKPPRPFSPTSPTDLNSAYRTPNRSKRPPFDSFAPDLDPIVELPRETKRQYFRRTLTDLLGLLYSPDRLAEEIIFFTDAAPQSQLDSSDFGVRADASNDAENMDPRPNDGRAMLGAARSVLQSLLNTEIDLPVPGFEGGTTGSSLIKPPPTNVPHTNHAATMIGYYMCIKAFLSSAMRAFTVQTGKQVEQLERAREVAFGKARREYVEASGALMERIHVYSKRVGEERQASIFLASRLSMAGEEIRQSRLSCETLRTVLKEVVRGTDEANTRDRNRAELQDKVTVPTKHVFEIYNLRERAFASEWMQSNADTVMRARAANMALLGGTSLSPQ